MNTRTAGILARKLMKEHGLTKEGWTFDFDSAKKRSGCCHHRTKTITISRGITRLNSEAEVLDTILHEIAHALVGGRQGHNIVWRLKAKEIGCTGARNSSEDTKLPPCKWIGSCPNGHEVSAARKVKRTKSCAKCYPYSYNEDFIITYRLNPKYVK